MKWDPEQYGEFAAERARPFIDLLAHINTDAPPRVTDLGCGPGTMTNLLAAMWPDAEIVGVDSSAEMIDSAQRVATGSVRFEVGDLAAWAGAAAKPTTASAAPTVDSTAVTATLRRVDPAAARRLFIPRSFFQQHRPMPVLPRREPMSASRRSRPGCSGRRWYR